MSDGTGIRRWIDRYITAGRVAAATVGFVSLCLLLVGLYKVDENAALPLWGWALLGALVALAVVAAFVAGRSRLVAPSEAVRLRGELEVANGYLFQAEDFMSSFREVVSQRDPTVALERLPRLRELLFDAVVQGVNTQPGEHIRCAYFAPTHEDGEPVLVARWWRGHSDDVRQLRLPADATSIAGRALSGGKPIYVPDARSDARVHETPVAGRYPVVTLFCLPTFPFSVEADAPVGVLSVTSNKPNAFGDADQNFISLCASLIGLLELAEQLYKVIGPLREALARMRERQPREVDGTSDPPPTIG